MSVDDPIRDLKNSNKNLEIINERTDDNHRSRR